MQRSISVLIAAAVATSAVSLAPAWAMPAAPTATGNDGAAVELVRDRYGRGHWRGRRGGHWGGGHWGGGDWGYGHNGYGFGLGAFGLATGLLFGSGLGYYGGYYGHPYYGGYYGNGYYDNGYYGNGGYDDYDIACAHKYRSYDPGSNTFLGYDGYRHTCQLY
jgi:hypothetical protein